MVASKFRAKNNSIMLFDKARSKLHYVNKRLLKSCIPLFLAWPPTRSLFFFWYARTSFQQKQNLLADLIQTKGTKWIPAEFDFIIQIAKLRSRIPIRSSNYTWDLGLAFCILGLDASIKHLYSLIFQKDNLVRELFFIDIGVNYGQNLLLFCMVSRNVVSFEPNPRCWGELDRILSANKFSPKIIKAAVGEKPGQAYLRWPGGNTWLSSVSDSATFGEDCDEDMNEIAVPIVTVDEQIQQTGSTFLVKIDVEGFEPEALRGSKNLLSQNDCLLLFEHKHEAVQGKRKLYAFFQSIGYEVFQIEIDTSRPLRRIASEEQYLQDTAPNHAAMRSNSKFSFLIHS